ncbi:hypothetical protein KD33_07740 [Clostridium sp. NCR]|nr:hypothetical protein KD33_07740 [Clostridium sp. NCR]
MIYNGLGNGTVIERNKQRIEYVKRLSKDKFLLESLFNDIFKYVELGELKQVKHKLSVLFCEDIPNNFILRICNNYNFKTDKEIREIKTCIIHRYVKYPAKGFIWNMFDVYMNYSN